MASAAISIVDRLIQLSTVRERNREKYFKNFIEPLYIDGEKIARDYMTLLAELNLRISQAGDGRDLVGWLEARRAEYKPLRDKVRELLRDGLLERRGKAGGDSLALLKKGLWGVIKGGVSVTALGHARTSEYGFGDHTVLDLLHHARIAVLDERSRELLARQVQGQKDAIERAWQDVARAYAELRKTYLA